MKISSFIKGVAATMFAVAVALSGCTSIDRAETDPLNPPTGEKIDYDNIRIAVTGDKPALESDTDNVKTRALTGGWAKGDRIAVFFNNTAPLQYVWIEYDNAEWKRLKESLTGIALTPSDDPQGTLTAFHAGSSTFDFDGTKFTGVCGDLLAATDGKYVYTYDNDTKKGVLTLQLSMKRLTTAVRVGGSNEKNKSLLLAGEGLQVMKSPSTEIADAATFISNPQAGMSALIEASDAAAGKGAVPDPIYTNTNQVVFHIGGIDEGADPTFELFETGAAVHQRTYTGKTLATGNYISIEGPWSDNDEESEKWTPKAADPFTVVEDLSKYYIPTYPRGTMIAEISLAGIVTGGIPPYIYTVTEGLPEGLTATNDKITGTLTKAGPAGEFKVTVEDSSTPKAQSKDIELNYGEISIPNFVAVTSIELTSATMTAGTPLTLEATVTPENATIETIVWTVKDKGTTNATITEGNKLNATAAGKVTVTATIKEGGAYGADFTRDFEITVTEPEEES